jgi:hypothetical protein
MAFLAFATCVVVIILRSNDPIAIFFGVLMLFLAAYVIAD